MYLFNMYLWADVLDLRTLHNTTVACGNKKPSSGHRIVLQTNKSMLRTHWSKGSKENWAVGEEMGGWVREE